MSVFYRSTRTDSTLEEEETSTSTKEVLFSNGGDVGYPGYQLYRQGHNIGAVVSTGNLTWTVQVSGIVPTMSAWTNIGVRWAPLVANDSEFEELVQRNLARVDDVDCYGECYAFEAVGGLELFMLDR